MGLSTEIGSRKARRKEQRRAKKKRRSESSDEGKAKPKEPKDTVSSDPGAKKRRRVESNAPNDNVSRHPSREMHSKHPRTKAKSQKKEAKSDPYAHLDPEVAAAMRSDDAEIADLEAKLGLGSKKDRSRLHREYARLEGYGDDFGDFLDNLDGLVDRVTGTDEQPHEARHMDSDAESDADSEASSADEVAVPMKDPFEHLDEDGESSEDGDGSDLEEHTSDDESSTADPDHHVVDTYQPSSGEDIYGKKLSSLTDEEKPKKYVPPHLRKKEASFDDESRKERIRVLQRAMNNALNRLSEDTLISVAQSLAQLYPSHPTSEVNDVIWKNLTAACISRPTVMSGMIPVYVACFAGVHLQTGDSVQLGGFLLEQTVHQLWRELKASRTVGRAGDAPTETDDGEISKEACNLVLVLCYLYNFSIVQCTVIYGVIRNLIEKFSELDVELLLLILSHCGFALRTDDPMALKDIVLAVKERALTAQKDGEASSSRVEYMVSAMTDLKNNKKRKQDMVFIDRTSKLRKLLGRIKSTIAAGGTVRSSDSCLRITLEDILNVETKGRWWKVGASWVGNQYKHRADSESSDDEDDEASPPNNSRATHAIADEDEKLLKLASKYRMNSDTRRSIFCIIMGSTDCDDAFEKLVRAGMLKNRTERDTVRVLMECCGNEKSYNPFYSHLAARVCNYQPQCKFTFQLAFWDTFKQFDSLKARKVANLAKLLFHLVAKHHALRLNVLKVIDMAPDEITENALIFLTVFFSAIFDSFDDPTEVYQLFKRGIPSGRALETGTKDLPPPDAVDESADGDGLRESFSVFFLQTLKSSPKNKKKSKFRANLKAAIKACESDELESMI